MKVIMLALSLNMLTNLCAVEIVCNNGSMVISNEKESGKTILKIYDAGVAKYFEDKVSVRSDCGYGYCSYINDTDRNIITVSFGQTTLNDHSISVVGKSTISRVREVNEGYEFSIIPHENVPVAWFFESCRGH